jgi:hypothetical protein
MHSLRIAVFASLALSTARAQFIEQDTARSTLRASMEQALLGPFEPLIGLTGPVVTNRPYRATVFTETAQTLADGTTIRRQANYRIARDGAGRIREENADTGRIFLSDPVERATYILDPQTHSARRMPLGAVVIPESAANHYRIRRPDGSMGRLANFPRPPEQVLRGPNTEDLGTQIIGNIVARGERNTTTYLTGSVGNSGPLKIVLERWYSNDLRIAVMTHHSDPRTGETTVRYTDIRSGPQPPDLFRVPAGYDVK